MRFVVTATRVITTNEGWRKTIQVPTFFIERPLDLLDSDVQGFGLGPSNPQAAAERVARTILGEFPAVETHICVCEVE